ncbi:MAG: RES family NAD+ phosphorylase [Panacibacter sp.]
MIVYRFSKKMYANDLSGMGAKLYGGRWNPAGIPVLYTSEHIALGLLEVLANANTLEELQKLQLSEIEFPSNALIEQIEIERLKKDWWQDFDYTQWLGAEVFKNSRCLAVKCPSAIIEKESNYILNPGHVDFKKVTLKTVTDFRFDERLFRAAL